MGVNRCALTDSRRWEICCHGSGALSKFQAISGGPRWRSSDAPFSSRLVDPNKDAIEQFVYQNWSDRAMCLRRAAMTAGCGNAERFTRRGHLGIDDPAYAPRVVFVSLDLADVFESARATPFHGQPRNAAAGSTAPQWRGDLPDGQFFRNAVQPSVKKYSALRML
ncbi:MAG: hypothetical protein JO266_12050 [Acidobacteria bacterium]|nr:hypothetical protein [Acidobacteriota bacterium]